MKKTIYLLMLAALAFSSCCKDKEVIEKLTPVRPGDFFYSDNTYSYTLDASKTVIGVVFWKDPANETKGKIISLDETIGPWGAYGVLENIQNANDGATNTRTVITARKGNPNFAQEYYSFNWIYQLKNNGKPDGRWYLPAANELSQQLFPNKDVVNASLKQIKAATTISERFIYWSSTEKDTDKARYIPFFNGDLLENNKDLSRHIRAISAF